jgi:hypothetical protein
MNDVCMVREWAVMGPMAGPASLWSATPVRVDDSAGALTPVAIAYFPTRNSGSCVASLAN